MKAELKVQPDKSATLAGTDSDWEEWGRKDPYYAVLSAPRFHRDAIDDSAITEFFESGQQHVEQVLSTLRRNFRSDFRSRRALDFGCGVGRIAVPLAKHAEEVTAIDISPSMLGEAARNAASQGMHNIEFLETDQLDLVAAGSFDLIHSYIVFQHIQPHRGMAILHKLLRKLEPGGLGALHFTIARNAPHVKRFVAAVRQRSSLANRIANMLQGKPVSGPAIYMYMYSLSEMIWSMRAAGCDQILTDFTQHGEYLGAMLYFKKS